MYCDICSCKHDDVMMHRTGLLNLKGSEDDFICSRCRHELASIARSFRSIADKIRYSRED